MTPEQKENVLKLIIHLRTTDIPQGFKLTVHNGKACALGSFIFTKEELKEDKYWCYGEVRANNLFGKTITNLVLTWNDKDRLTFPQIADKLEEYVRTN